MRHADTIQDGIGLEKPHTMGAEEYTKRVASRTVWIDLDNSPHVPFFAPIIDELKRRGYAVAVTARDCFQVCELAKLLKVEYKLVGRHYGKHRLLKLAGLLIRTLQLVPTVLAERPAVALSHGSRSQLLLSKLLRIPSIIIYDYEFAKGLGLLHPNWVMAPDVIRGTGIRANGNVMAYPGLKEDVYVPRFHPDPSIRSYLRIKPDDLVVTVRPPATEAHYHNPESEALLQAVFTLLDGTRNAKIILLPRNQRQEGALRQSWSRLFDSGKIVVPDHAVDGLNLIWYSDLVISGGGTMNREAAVLGVPVYSIFRGKLGAVDRYLADAGRLVLLQSVNDVQTKLLLRQRNRPPEPPRGNGDTLKKLVDNVVSVLESRSGSGDQGDSRR